MKLKSINHLKPVPLQKLNIKDENFNSEKRRPPPICVCFIETLKKVMPIESIQYNVKIHLGIAVVQICKTTKMNCKSKCLLDRDVPSDLSYLFSISPDSVFTKMEVQFGDKNLLGLIKEKESARAEYNKGVKEGKTMVYSEKDDEFPDLMRIKLGNLAPNSKLKIALEYTQPLQVCVNSFWKFSISPFIHPRYHLNNQTYKKARNYINKIVDLSTFNTNHKQDITIELNMPDALTFVESPTHKLQRFNIRQFQKRLINTLKLDPAHIENFCPAKPFILLFATKNLHKPTAVLTHTTDDALAHQKYCATVSFIPKFNPLPPNDAYAAFMQVQDLESQEFDYDQKGEYIFVIDRSGSMEGVRMEKAKEALIIFIRSLPKDSYFNIISFGTTYKRIWNNSKRYNSETQAEAIQIVERMRASMGGTEILSVFQFEIYEDSKIQGYPKNIFLLTDGFVEPDPVIDLVRDHRKADMRVYTVGIGSDCSQYLIEKLAEVGNGRFQFVDDDENLNAKIIELLEDSITPYLQNFSMDTNIENPFAVVPNPESFISLKKNQPFTCQILFPQPIDQCQKVDIFFECIDPQIQQLLGCVMHLNIADSIENPHFHKLAAYRLITEIENASKFNDCAISRCFVNVPQIRSKELIDLSLQHQILSRVTAFVCEVVELGDNWKQYIKQKVKSQQICYEQETYDRYDGCMLKLCEDINQKPCKLPQIIQQSKFQLNQKKCLQNTSNFRQLSNQNSIIKHSLNSATMTRKVNMIDRSYNEDELLMCDQQKDAISIYPNNLNGLSSSILPNQNIKTKQIGISLLQYIKNGTNTFSYKQLINNSQPDGSFAIDANIAKIIRLELNYVELKLNLPKILLAQVLILWYLEKYCYDDKDSWQLIYKKAIKYLQSRNVNYYEIQKHQIQF